MLPIPGMTFGQARKKLSTLAKAKGMNQQKLADAIGCGKSFLSNVLAGKKSFGLRYAPRVEELYGIPASAWDRGPRKAA